MTRHAHSRRQGPMTIRQGQPTAEEGQTMLQSFAHSPSPRPRHEGWSCEGGCARFRSRVHCSCSNNNNNSHHQVSASSHTRTCPTTSPCVHACMQTLCASTSQTHTYKSTQQPHSPWTMGLTPANSARSLPASRGPNSAWSCSPPPAAFPRRRRR